MIASGQPSPPVGIISATVLGAGLALYPSTQLRAGGLPVGPGEVLLLIWMGMAALRVGLLGEAVSNRALRRVHLFWLAMVVAQGIGMILGLVFEPFQDFKGIVHDVLAYALLISLGTLLSLDLVSEARRRRVIWTVVVVGSISLTLQMGSIFGVLIPPGVEPYWYNRFRGWSLDPNVLGFFNFFVIILAVYLAETSVRPKSAVFALVLATPAVIAGILSRSDTFVVASTMAGSVYLIGKSVTWLETVEMGPSLRGATVVLGLLAFPLATLSLAPFWSAAAENVAQRANDVAEKDNQAATRFGLWREAINKGSEAWMVGYGPGPHLTSKSYKRPPPDKFEAHNTALDIFTQGGILALLAFILLCATTFVSVWRAKMAALAALIAGAVIFSMFHFIVRHPNFWFCIVLCLLQSEMAPRTALKTGNMAPQ